MIKIAFRSLTLLVPISQNGQTLKQFVGNLPTISLSVFDRFVGLTLKGLIEDVVFFLKSLD